MKKHNRFVIIMAGGKGERFWPVSREATPKQLIALLGKRSFLQQTVDRVQSLVPLENILVITNTVQAPQVRSQLRIPKHNVIAEPCGRDTCAAVVLGAAIVGRRDPQAVMAVLPADHVIPKPRDFCKVLGNCFAVAERERVLVTIGIQPTEPATGYGYIKVGQPLGRDIASEGFYKAMAFVEKPPLKTAQRYLKSGQYRWNAGMFIWSVEAITAAIEEHQPTMKPYLNRWLKVSNHAALIKALEQDYPTIQKVSVDFALMEKATNVVVADGTFDWDDLGAWTALTRHLPLDENGNCGNAEIVQVDSHRNIVFDNRRGPRKPLALLGVHDSIVVATDDVLMVAAVSEAQKIKTLVAKVREHVRYGRLA